MLERIDTTVHKDLEPIQTGSTSKTLTGSGFFDDKEEKHLDITNELEEPILDDHDLLSTITDKEAEFKKITHIIDVRMLPLFCIFYFMDYLDRANIGNATLGGIQHDLHLTPQELSTAISAFYITYIIFEVPSNIVLKRTNPVMWLSLIMLLWGVMTLVMAFAKNFASLLICRLLLGAAESGYIPGILYMMSRVYRPSEFGLRIAFLISMASISGIVSGPIAYGTAFLEGQKGLHGWQYLFILEGVPTICLSVVSYFYLFDDIKNVHWLSPAQKVLHRQTTNTSSQEQTQVTWRNILSATMDWKTCLFSTVYFLNAINMVSYHVFLPTIIDGFGFPVLTSQLLTAPPNVITAIATVLGGYLADKYDNKRGVLMTTGFSIASLGYMLLLILHGRWARYTSLFIIPLGIGLQAPANVGWSAINFPRLEIRVIAVAVVVMIGNSGSVVASYLYPLHHAPHYYMGNTFNLCVAISGALFSALTSYLLYRQNQKLEQASDKEKDTRFRYYY
ncbi:major facilitator superfamily domain-containing protein [Gilbertella persicaria]|nr:major facilitator superfamily domain-containing protein [Gilbertella persicaria]KAI8092333.1 major facilitator superfamily domain-containing protein [Gilbertella persicaria]